MKQRTTTPAGNGSALEANVKQRIDLARYMMQLFSQDPMYKKLGGYITPILQNTVQFYFTCLPLKPEVVIKEKQLAGTDDVHEEKYYKFSFTWHHPCIEGFSITVDHEMPVEDFDRMAY